VADRRRWVTVTRPPVPNQCPYCMVWFVVEDMTEHHMISNACGLVPGR
jgi:hypothetical protein